MRRLLPTSQAALFILENFMTTIATTSDDAGADTPVTSSATTFRLIREGFAPKMGQRSTGQIGYQVLTNEDHTEVFLRIAKNQGGGYASDEAVSIHALVRCIADREAEEPLRSGAFKPAFSGRSSNNSGFIAAVMLTELLIRRDADRPHILHDCCKWNAWCSEQLAVTGDLPTVRVGKEPVVQAPVTSTEITATADDVQGDPVMDVDVSGDATSDVGDPGHLPDDGGVPDEPESARPGRKTRKGRMLAMA